MHRLELTKSFGITGCNWIYTMFRIYFVWFIILYLLVNLLKISCYPINRNGKRDLNVSKISFLEESVEIPFNANSEEANNIHVTLKKYENQVNQLKEEAKYCKTLSCFVIFNRLKVVLTNVWFGNYFLLSNISFCIFRVWKTTFIRNWTTLNWRQNTHTTVHSNRICFLITKTTYFLKKFSKFSQTLWIFYRIVSIEVEHFIREFENVKNWFF